MGLKIIEEIKSSRTRIKESLVYIIVIVNNALCIRNKHQVTVVILVDGEEPVSKV